MTLQRESAYDTLQPVAMLETFTGFCRNVLERYNGNERVLKDMEAQETDIIHYVELSDTLKSGEAYKIYAKLRDTLRQRRDAKNENDLLLPLYECLMKNPDIVNQLNKVLGTTRTKAEVISKRKYSARTDVLEQ